METVVLWVDLAVLAVFAVLAGQRIVVGEREAGSNGTGPTTRSAALKVLDRRLAVSLAVLVAGAAVYLALGLS
jgi:hypothetical protein